ncbi:hypothetical protein GOODEAATRI_021907, partial [Goodea atripinnis]
IGLLSYVDSGVDFKRCSVHEAHHANLTGKQFLFKCDRVKLHPLTWKQQFSPIWILMPLFGLFLHVLLGYKPSLVCNPADGGNLSHRFYRRKASHVWTTAWFPSDDRRSAVLARMCRTRVGL